MEFQKISILVKRSEIDASLRLVSEIQDLCRELNLQSKQITQNASKQDLIDLCHWSDLLIVVGGDGTMLQASIAATYSQVPVCGVNLGRVGFLADIDSAAAIAPLREILAGNYKNDHRLLVQVLEQQSKSMQYLALNEFVIHSSGISQLLEMELCVDGDLVYQCRADGLIIATPTGSTAYSLSAGGPILHQSLDCLTIVPMMPYAMHTGSIVVSSMSEVEVKILENSRYDAVLTKDGEEVKKLHMGESITITQAPNKLNLIRPENADNFDAIRKKLHWGYSSFIQ